MIKSKPLKWHGGKHYLADRILSLMPEHTHYVEPYFGGGQVLFRKPCEGVSEVANDLNGGLVNFWRTLQDTECFAAFQRRVAMTPFSQQHFNESTTDSPLEPGNGVQCDSEAAAQFFIRYRQSRQGLGKDFATLSRNRTRRGMNEQVSSWLSAVEGLPEAHERLKRVVILNRDAIDVIKQQDGPNTFFYLDPPYLHDTRVTTNDYECEMSESQHEKMLQTLARIEGKFILSGYCHDLYTAFQAACNWHREDITIDNKASSRKTKQQKTESLWMNFEPALQ